MNTIEHMHMTFNKIDQVFLCLVITSFHCSKEANIKQEAQTATTPSLSVHPIREKKNRVYLKNYMLAS